MHNFLVRSLTAGLFCAVVIFSITLGPVTFFFLFSLIAMVGLNEYYRLAATRFRVNVRLGLFSGLLFFGLLAGVLFYHLNPLVLFFIFPCIAMVPVRELIGLRETPLVTTSVTVFGLMYVVVPFSAFIACAHISGRGYDYQSALGFILLLWANDTGAYLVGMVAGKHHMIEKISPKKTWEGFFGGFVACAVSAVVIATFLKEWNAIHWIIVSVIIVVAATLGDLIESMFKRELSAKDSGNLLPGHGGILDRFDGLLVAAPIFFIYLVVVRLYP